MTDERLRRLERDAQEDPALAGRLLVERARAGILGEPELRLAAYLGEEAAARMLGEAPHVPGVRDLQARVAGLYGWGAPVALRAFVAVARLLLPHFEEERPGDDRVEGTLQAVEAWIDCPCEPHGNECVLRASPAFEAASRVSRTRAAEFAALLAGRAGLVALETTLDPSAASLEPFRRTTTSWAAELLEHGLRAEPLWEAVSSALLAWLLGAGGGPEARAYSARGAFQLAERIAHRTFGLGTVTDVSPRRLAVTFDDGQVRLLVHRQGA